ncbi:zinc finger, CCHC-type, retrotransposon gag domain protein [Tanacetum coccineum]|uniref:Zinc finger, CCHC-type, retrotransposon gag domain protein n=1 Tax=Tanacetum coccineum TaxID=301880 RepID=A0ABQ4WG81_9ASTR
METKDTFSSCSDSDEQEMQQMQDKAKESCMVSFRPFYSHLKVLSNNDLKRTWTAEGFKRAFATLFDQDVQTFTGIRLINVDQLEKQLDKVEFQETGSMTAFRMPPRRSTYVNNEVDPAFTTAVAQAVADLLPTLTARITDEIRQNENNGNNERFQKEKPQTFSSTSTPVEAENWIAHIEKIFEVLGCDDQFKARLATYKLEADAHSWWRAYKQAKRGDAYVVTLSWNDFRDIFFLQYFPYSEKERCEREYKSIRQLPEETSTDFMKRFLRLAGFLGAKAGTQEEQAKHFKWGLNDFVLDRILNTEFTDVAQVANTVRNIEIFRDRPKNEGDNKRDIDGHHIRPSETPSQGSNPRADDRRDSDRYGNRGRHGNMDRYGTDIWRGDRQGSKRNGNGSDRPGNGSQKAWRDQDQQVQGQHYSRSYGSSSQSGYLNYNSCPPCNLCGKFHPGKACHRATGACFECGEVGHLAKDCKKGSKSSGGK